MTNLPKSPTEYMAQGSWWMSGAGYVFFCCPACGDTTALVDYDIDTEGTVLPEVVCSNRHCKHHEYIKLDGWKVKEAPIEE